MRDNLFHASTAESIGSRHAETYRRKMRSANAGGANATIAGLNSPISEEREKEREREEERGWGGRSLALSILFSSLPEFSSI